MTFDREVLPYGVFSVGGGPRRVGVAVEDGVLDLAQHLDPSFEADSLNAFMAQGPERWAEVRDQVRTLVDHPLVPLDQVTLHLPFEVADYVDFYASEQHATNLGRMFRPDAEPLLPNWKHLPVGYHGRAGTVVVDGTPVRRPRGLRLPGPTYGPSLRLDVEVELGFVVGVPSELGNPVGTGAFAEHVFGAVVLNDWSARDIQSYEYVPLGPFLGKSFATSVSPWVVPLDALPRVPAPVQDPPVADYLRTEGDWGYDVELTLAVNGEVVSRPPYRSMYWTAPQMLAHLTANGASLRTGDLFASGTVSGDAADERGSLIELSWNGRDPVNGRTFLEDGDTVTISAATPAGASLGAVTGTVLPA
ncbi:MAG TPA: fumarylacetoacetate hydrolase family protein [Mycobacteriales bacterium]|nr:fumarylacetoacetate hydrolase family protein [Mycobacteriales bacterium]